MARSVCRAAVCRSDGRIRHGRSHQPGNHRTTGGATLDNIDNTIAGYGQLGAGALTLINEKAGTIEATGGTIVLDTGAVAATNKGLMEALGGTLTVRTVLDGTAEGPSPR